MSYCPPVHTHTHTHTHILSLSLRALGGRKYRSFSNLRLAFKNHVPPGSSPSSLSSSINALVVRGIIPGTPASLTTQLQPGTYYMYTLVGIPSIRTLFYYLMSLIVRFQRSILWHLGQICKCPIIKGCPDSVS